MALYKEQTETVEITTTTYVRSNVVTVTNSLNKAPFITYVEEKVQIKDGEAKSLGNIGSISEFLTVDNLDEEFALLNPTTGASLGTVGTYQQLQVLLHSLYYHLAAKRDAQ